MKNKLSFLCSLWQNSMGVDIFSSTPELSASLNDQNLIPFIPGYKISSAKSGSGFSVSYEEANRFSLNLSPSGRSIHIQGGLKLVVSGEVIPYLACSLLEVKRQRVGMTSAHLASVEYNGKAILLMGKEGSGKTSVALQLCRTHGFSLIANDLGILGYNKGRALIFEGTKSFWLRLKPMEKHHPDLVKHFPLDSHRDSWTTRALVYPDQLGIKVTNGELPIEGIFLLHLDERVDNVYTERSLGRWPRLYLYENFSRYIRQTASPVMGGKNFRYLTYFPSLDNKRFHLNRVRLIDHLIDEVGIYYLSGMLGNVAEYIAKSIKEK